MSRPHSHRMSHSSSHRPSRVRRLAATVLLLPMLAGACRAVPVTTVDPGAQAVMRVYDSRASRWTTFEAMTADAARADFVFFGEQHDDPVTHAAELATLAALGERRGRVILAMEMFERDVQPLLDQYTGGRVAESAFLAGSRPWERYTTDYRAMMELARVRGWPVVASNIPRRIASAVSRRGLAHLDTLSATDRAFAARENQCPRDRYFERFAETVGSHPAPGGGGGAAADAAAMRAMTERFYEAQCVKDEAMGESVVTAWEREGKRTPVFHVDGAFHSDYGQGTAERALRRAKSARTTIISAIPVASLDAADPAAHRGRADYLVFTLAPKK